MYLAHPYQQLSRHCRAQANRLAVSAVVVAVASSAAAQQNLANGSDLSLYGMPGHVDTPSAEALPDGEIALTFSGVGGQLKNTVAFQAAPRLTTTFRYSVSGPDYGEGENFDRSLDLAFRLLDEGEIWPSVSVGLRDFAGTGRFSSEYIVATKHFGSSVVASAGLGWGRIAGAPRETLSGSDAVNTYKYWFSGTPKPFGAVTWNASDNLSFTAEYSPDAYDLENRLFGFSRKNRFNFGTTYQFKNNWAASAYYVQGAEVGFRISKLLNPKTTPAPGGREASPMPVRVRGANGAAAQDWGGHFTDSQQVTDRTRDGLLQQGLVLAGLDIQGDAATVKIRNLQYGAGAQAIGRTARVLTNTLPPEIEDFRIVLETAGMITTATTLQRSDVETLEWHPDGAALSYARADIQDGYGIETTDVLAFPKFSARLGPYISPSIFDPEAPVRADFGVEAEASYALRPNLILSGNLRYPLIGNKDNSTRVSDSVLPNVRSDAAEYDRQADLELSHLTAEYFFRPGRNLYGRVTAGYLERMFAGVSAEVLWKDPSKPYAIGADINLVQKRGYEVLFDLQDYRIATGHISFYRRLGENYRGQIDVGRYLAGDYGATLKLERQFNNGWRVGAFMTLTDVPFDDFGEGAFDKGLYFEIPHAWLTGEASKTGYANTIHFISRDGGAQLNVRNRLHDLLDTSTNPALQQRWGRVWR
jgi:hypothetical protein